MPAPGPNIQEHALGPWAARALTVFFGVCISLPVIGMLWQGQGKQVMGDIAKFEKRQAATWQTPAQETAPAAPAASPAPATSVPAPMLPSVPFWKTFSTRAENYARDHFEFRDTLLNLHHSLKYRLGISPHPSVVLGTDGWVFYGGQGEWKDVRGLTELPVQQKLRWLVYLNRVHDLLQERGIPFLFVIAPDKSTTYAEYLPLDISAARRKHRLKDLLEFLRYHQCRAPVIDLTGTMHTGKSEARVFLKLDTHWNAFGAALGAAAMLDRIRSLGVDISLPHVSMDDFTMEPGPLGDLSAYLRQDWPEVQPVRKPSSMPPFTGSWGPGGLTRLCPAGSGHLVMFQDSFGLLMADAVTGCFERSEFIVGQRDEEEVYQVLRDSKPAVIVLQTVERNIEILNATGPAYEEDALVRDFLPTQAYTLTPSAGDALRVASGLAMVEESGSGFLVKDFSGGSRITLSDIPSLPEGLKALRCTVSTPDAGSFRVFTSATPLPSEASMRQGINHIIVWLPHQVLQGPIGISIGDHPGASLLGPLEIRTQAAPDTLRANP